MQSQRKHAPVFSFEISPPKTSEGAERLRVVCERLVALRPSYVSVTCGTGGAPRDHTSATTREFHERFAPLVEAAPHLIGIGSTQQTVREILAAYRRMGIRRLVVVRGDLPATAPDAAGQFPHASDLVAFIRAETGSYFHVEVAAHPEFHPGAPSAQADLEHFKRKIEAGATSALTQYFYNPDAYLRFVESCERLGVTLPIVPGIMPVTSYERLARFSEVAGVEIPRWLGRRLEGFGNDVQSLRAFGLDVVTDLCERLLREGAPGLHLYTMNSAEAACVIWRRLGLPEHHVPAVSPGTP
jgi:methylenetetrahydrofolate reductase (NADPH)